MFNHSKDEYIERKLLHIRSQLIAYQDMIENGHRLNEVTDCNLIDNLQLQIEEVLCAVKQAPIIDAKPKSEVFSLV